VIADALANNENMAEDILRFRDKLLQGV